MPKRLIEDGLNAGGCEPPVLADPDLEPDDDGEGEGEGED